MKYSDTALRELSARYRNILKKCAIFNAAIFACAAASPAMADTFVLLTGEDFGTKYESYGKEIDGNTIGGVLASIVSIQGTDTTIGEGFTFSNNVSGVGGAVSVFVGQGVQIGSGTTFINNEARYDGGALGVYGGALLSENVNFIGNKAQTDAANDSMQIGGGAISLGAVSNTTITNSLFENNTSGFNGGAIATRRSDPEAVSKISDNSAAEISISGSTFSGNRAEGYTSGGALVAGNGGAIYNTFYKNVVVDGSTFSGNYAAANGGAINNDGLSVDKLNKGGVMTVSNSSFLGNRSEVSGGAIHNSGEMTLSNAVFGSLIQDETGAIVGAENGNSSSVAGGAIYNGAFSGLSSVAGVEVGDGSVFAGNVSGQGGAIANFGAGSKLSIGNNVIFAYNTANSVGGAVSNVDTTDVVTVGDNVQFIGNKSVAGQGGAYHNQRANTTIGNAVKFYNNIAEGYGGGAIYQDTDSTASSVSIGDSAEFVGNKTSTSHGGAIMNYNEGDAALIAVGSGALFNQNEAFKTGGAISNWGGEVTIAENATFTNNVAGTSGGAIYNDPYNKSDAVFEIAANAVFENNQAAGQGGAIYNTATMSLAGATFKGNTANGALNDIHNEGTLNLSGNIVFDGGVSGNGYVNFADGSVLTASLGTTIIEATNVSFGQNVTLDMLIATGMAGGEYDFILANVSGVENVTLNPNTLYDLSLNENGKFSATLKDSSTIAEQTGVAQDTADALYAVVATNGEGTDLGNAIAEIVSEAVQTGNHEGAAAVVETLAPAKSQHIIGVAQDVNSMLANAVSTRLSSNITSIETGRSSGDETTAKGSVWAQGLYSYAKQSGSVGFKANSAGVALGIDTHVTEALMLGLGYGYTRTDAHPTGRELTVDGHNFFVYGEYKPSAWYINAMFSYGMSNYSETKNPAGILIDTDYDVNSYALNAMAGYDLANGFAPEGGLRYLITEQDAYFDGVQSVDADTNDVLTLVAGIKYTTAIKTDNWTFNPKLRVAATYDLITDRSEASVQVLGGGSYQIVGERLKRFGVEVGAGVSSTIDNWEFSLEYNGAFREDFRTHTGLLKAKYNF